jgi:hypothetical protein
MQSLPLHTKQFAQRFRHQVQRNAKVPPINVALIWSSLSATAAARNAMLHR